MFDREKVLAVLTRRFAGARPEQLAAAANAIVRLGDEREDVTDREDQFGCQFSPTCSDSRGTAARCAASDLGVSRLSGLTSKSFAMCCARRPALHRAFGRDARLHRSHMSRQLTTPSSAVTPISVPGTRGSAESLRSTRFA